MSAVIDSSALLAMLRDEPGAAAVREIIDGAAMTTVNLAEVVGHYARRGALEAAIHAVLDNLPIDRIPFDQELAFASGLLLPVTRSAGLSLGDRACLALAARLGLPAFTADRAWRNIAAAVGVEIELIR